METRRGRCFCPAPPHMRSPVPDMLNVAKLNWFPGHMAKATKEISQRLKGCDLVIEVRDARIPFSSRNDNLAKLTEHKKRLVVLNKADLADPCRTAAAVQQIRADGLHTMLLCAKSRNLVREIMPCAMDALGRVLPPPRKRDDVGKTTKTFYFMVCGIPNVGKSTIINALRSSRTSRGHVARVGALPGVTRHLAAILVNEEPPMYVLDSPGVMLPRISDIEHGFKLALSGTVKDGLVDPLQLAEYLNKRLNMLGCTTHYEFCGCTAPSVEVHDLLVTLATTRALHLSFRHGDLDLARAARLLIQSFRDGRLGRISLD